MSLQCTDEKLGRLILLYELDRLDEKDRCLFEDHMMSCPFCLEELEKAEPLMLRMKKDRREILAELERRGVRLPAAEPAPDQVRQPATTKPLRNFQESLKDWWNRFTRPVVWIPVSSAALILLLLLSHQQVSNPYLPYLDHSPAPYDSSPYRGAVEPPREAQEAFKTGMEAYTQDRYAEASRYLERAVKIAPAQDRYWLYLGVSRYLDQRPHEAVKALQRAQEATNKSLQSAAQWYLAQAWLAQGEVHKALPLLQTLSQREGDYTLRADTLLSRIQAIEGETQ